VDHIRVPVLCWRCRSSASGPLAGQAVNSLSNRSGNRIRPTTELAATMSWDDDDWQHPTLIVYKLYRPSLLTSRVLVTPVDCRLSVRPYRLVDSLKDIVGEFSAQWMIRLGTTEMLKFAYIYAPKGRQSSGRQTNWARFLLSPISLIWIRKQNRPIGIIIPADIYFWHRVNRLYTASLQSLSSITFERNLSGQFSSLTASLPPTQFSARSCSDSFTAPLTCSAWLILISTPLDLTVDLRPWLLAHT